MTDLTTNVTTKTAAQRLEDWLPERTRNDPEALANFRWRVKEVAREASETTALRIRDAIEVGVSEIRSSSNRRG